MKIESCAVGPIRTNCYLVEDDGELIVIDPGDDLTRIVADIKARPVKEIVCTHFHWDHLGALSGLKDVTGASAAIGQADAAYVEGVSNMEGHDLDHGYGAPRFERTLRDGDTVTVGGSTFTVIETPGHSAGSICLYCPEQGVLFAGDTLFSKGRFGRTDFPGGSMDAMIQTLGSKFAGIPDDVIVYSGHEGSSTMGVERALNPYLR